MESGDDVFFMITYTLYEKMKTEVLGIADGSYLPETWTIIFSVSQWDEEFSQITYAPKWFDECWLIWERG